MKGRNGSWWGWLIAAFVLLAVLGDRDIPVLPLIIGFVLLGNVFGGRRAISSRRGGHHGRGGRALPGGYQGGGHGGHGGPDQLRVAYDTWTGPAQDGPMPTIDVPRYPGGASPSGGPGSPYGNVTGPPPPPPGQPASPLQPPPGPSGDLTPPPPPPDLGTGAVSSTTLAGGAPHTSSDPVVSLGQLHLARCGRDLHAAAQHGTATDVARVLDEVSDLSRRMQDTLGGAGGTPGSGRKAFQAGLRAIDRLVEDARGEHPPGARLTRLTQACLRMGQTGRHE